MSAPTVNPQSKEAYKIASSTEYDRLAQDFLKNVSSYTLFHTDVQFNADGRIVASRVHARHAPGAFASAQNQLDAMNALRDCAVSSGLDAFPFSQMYVTDVAEIESLIGAFANNTISAMVVVLLCCAIMPGMDVHNVLILGVLLFMCCVEVVGLISLMGVQFWCTILAMCVISIGLAVDYSLHIGHVYGLHWEAETCCTKLQRAEYALVHMGSSVLRGATTTFLGVCPLFFGAFTAMDQFALCVAIIGASTALLAAVARFVAAFATATSNCCCLVWNLWMLTAACFVAAAVFAGILHGFVVLPILLSWIGSEHPLQLAADNVIPTPDGAKEGALD